MRLRSDSGFTLTELLVVLVLMGLIMSGAYSLLRLTYTGTTISEREAWTAREIGAPLDFAERTISQNRTFDTAYPGLSEWRLAFNTQRGASGVQNYVIEVPSNPNDHRLLITINHGSGGAPVAWSTSNFNRAANQPLFTYFDYEGNEIDPVSQDAISQARSVKVTIVAEHAGRRFTDSRTVFLRNR